MTLARWWGVLVGVGWGGVLVVAAELVSWGSGLVVTGGAVWMVLTGRLIPRGTHQEMLELAKRWQAAYEVEVKRGDLLALQVGELMELSRSSAEVLGSLRGVSSPPPVKEPL